LDLRLETRSPFAHLFKKKAGTSSPFQLLCPEWQERKELSSLGRGRGKTRKIERGRGGKTKTGRF
jgi:hypothetical protein